MQVRRKQVASAAHTAHPQRLAKPGDGSGHGDRAEAVRADRHLRRAPAAMPLARPGEQASPVLRERDILRSWWAVGSASSMLAQHAILASSSVFQLALMHATTLPAVGLWAGLYFGSFLLPQVPKALYAMCTTQWRLEATARYQKAAFDVNFGRTEAYDDPQLSRQVGTTFGIQAPEAIKAYINTISEGTGRALSFATHGAVLAVLIDPWLAAAFVVSGGVALGGMTLADHLNRPRAAKENALLEQVNSQRAGFVGNTLTGNRYTAGRWQGSLNERFSAWAAASNRSERTAAVVGACVSVACAIPVVAVCGGRLLQLSATQGHGNAVIALLGLMPRAMFTLENQQNLVTFLPRVPAVRANFRTSMARSVAVSDLRRIIAPHRITVTAGSRTISLRDVLVDPEQISAPGRYTLRGPNGAGKSTALRTLKTYFGARAFYLPKTHALSLASGDQGSDGQERARAVQEILERVGPEVTILMLDEWDDALDAQARQVIDRLLAEASGDRAIVEVTHRS